MALVRKAHGDGVRCSTRPFSGPQDADAFAGGASRLDSRREWQAAYIRRLLVSDTLIVIAAVALAHWVRFGDSGTLTTSGIGYDLSYALVSALLIVAWLTTLTIFRTRTVRVIGSGPDEYRRIFVSTVRLFGFIAMLALLFRLDLARLYLAIAFPVGLAALLVSRWLWRQAIARKRSRGEFLTSVLVVGNERASGFSRNPSPEVRRTDIAWWASAFRATQASMATRSPWRAVASLCSVTSWM